MATIAVPRPRIGTLSPAMACETIGAPPSLPASPVPNKHIPVCPPGPAPIEGQPPPSAPRPRVPPLLFLHPEPPAVSSWSPSPSPSPSSSPPLLSTVETAKYQVPSSLLYPPDAYCRVRGPERSPLYRLSAAQVAAAVDHQSRQPLPDPALVFPWLHGLHPCNAMQQAFFSARRRAARKTPSCLRGITIVKADGDLSVSRLKGAIGPDEVLRPGSPHEFLELDPLEGFSVRNFQIQTAKAAMTSDIIVYGEDSGGVEALGRKVVEAQQRWQDKHAAEFQRLPAYNTFICLDPFAEFEHAFPELVAVDAAGRHTGHIISFVDQERREMHAMTEASEISPNVWLGPSPDPATAEDEQYDILIECCDLGRIGPAALESIANSPDRGKSHHHYLDFPSSGTVPVPTWSHEEVDGILLTCKWIFHLSHGTHPNDRVHGAHSETTRTARPRLKFLIHCPDGYTESTLLAIAYLSFSTGQPVTDAWINLHTAKRRNFFAYAADVALLTAIAPRLLHESPVCANKELSEITAALTNEPKWLAGLDGSLPSRILDYMYLGNLGHANNPDLLRVLGIRQILSVGETAMWREDQLDEWGDENICIVRGVQDNGIDPLANEFERCLEFIERGRRNGTATLVHCRVGVSRSATICIAEVMRALGLSFPRAYCFVRARRLNVIIQPHLRFVYELLKWEERLQQHSPIRGGSAASGQGGPFRSVQREFEWSEIAREVALMNRPYVRSGAS